MIGQQIETLLLQIYRYEAGATDLLAKVEARQRSAETLDRIQQEIDARRHAARELIELVAPDWQGEPEASVETEAIVVAANGSANHSSAVVDMKDLTYRSPGGMAIQVNGDQENDEWIRLVGEALRGLNNPGALASCNLMARLPRSSAAQQSSRENGVLFARLAPAGLEEKESSKLRVLCSLSISTCVAAYSQA